MIPWDATGFAVLPGYRLGVMSADGAAGVGDRSGEAFDELIKGSARRQHRLRHAGIRLGWLEHDFD